MDQSKIETFALPNGHEVKYTPAEIDGGEGYILEVFSGSNLLSRTCSCNGVSRSCPEGTSPHCDCTQTPPVLRCV